MRRSTAVSRMISVINADLPNESMRV